MAKGHDLHGYVPGHDTAQDEHDTQMAALSDRQIEGLARAIRDFMDMKRAEAVGTTTARVVPFRRKR